MILRRFQARFGRIVAPRSPGPVPASVIRDVSPVVDVPVSDEFASLIRDLHVPDVTDEKVSDFARRGWTVQALTQLIDMARWATDVGANIVYTSQFNETMASDVQGGRTLLEYGDQLVQRGYSVSMATAWLSAYLACPSYQSPESAAVIALIWDQGSTGDRVAHRRWWALGTDGPLLWAAGLLVAEAEREVAAPTLEAEGLRVLAGLRGFRFP